MAGEERDKTRVYLERVKTLEERARVALGAAAGLAGVFFTAASLIRNLRLVMVAAAVWSAATLVTASAYSFLAAERLWERLMRDPAKAYPLLVALFGAGLVAIGLAALIATIMGWW
ncbi:hypothetical protein Pyrfu_1907 [Pyrolobus fumarii 1A]|uniref:Uncharacterized protein n=1 Tax=Pyrolobus fumarii (strain DSM 11204 / 1A) TaxID=694429 RepID=G0ED82_PYRF1|nr:hypothetical protein [Pyrolobus fumarii]AEM39760.1 hypothetical protein Pyrfu_1907 [Pyrolobus fumarii 1A]